MKSTRKSITAAVALAALATGLVAPASAQTETATNSPISLQGVTSSAQGTPLPLLTLGQAVNFGPALATGSTAPASAQSEAAKDSPIPAHGATSDPQPAQLPLLTL